MKLLLLAGIIFGVVQASLTASIATENDIESTRSHIERLQNDWKAVPGANPAAIDNFVNIFKRNFRQNSTDTEIIGGTAQLMGLAVNVGVSKINKTIFEQFSKHDEEHISSEEIETTTPKGITKEDLEEIEVMLSKELTHEQTKHTMRILRGFRNGASAQEKEAALIDLFTSALNGVFGGQQKGAANNDSSQSNEI